VIASEVGGTSEVVRNEETGLLLQPGDPESLAEAIIRLFEDEKLCQRLRINAMQEIKGKFSWETLTEELLRQYQSLLPAAFTIMQGER
jgi:glycosyltransferase involved in cell wall biosynthesis